MLLLPSENLTISNANDEANYPSTTYPYQPVSNTFGAISDPPDALATACQKRLSTQVEHERAYSASYGMDWGYALEQSDDWKKANLGKRMEECLRQDDRVTSVRAIYTGQSGNALTFNITLNGSTAFNFTTGG